MNVDNTAVTRGFIIGYALGITEASLFAKWKVERDDLVLDAKLTFALPGEKPLEYEIIISQEKTLLIRACATKERIFVGGQRDFIMLDRLTELAKQQVRKQMEEICR